MNFCIGTAGERTVADIPLELLKAGRPRLHLKHYRPVLPGKQELTTLWCDRDAVHHLCVRGAIWIKSVEIPDHANLAGDRVNARHVVGLVCISEQRAVYEFEFIQAAERLVTVPHVNHALSAKRRFVERG